MASSLDYSGLAAYTDQLAFKDIIRQSVLEGTTFKYISKKEGVAHSAAINYIVSSLVVQGGKCLDINSASGSVTFGQATLTVCDLSVVEGWCPIDEKDYWLGVLMEKGRYIEDISPKEFAVVYTADKIAKLEQAIEYYFWAGDTTGTYSTSYMACNGMFHILDSTSATASLVLATASGAITPTNALQVFDNMYAQVVGTVIDILNEPDITAFCGHATFNALCVALRQANYFINYIGVPDGANTNTWVGEELWYPNANFKVVSTVGFDLSTTKNKIVMTTAHNLWIGWDSAKDPTSFRIWYSQDFNKVYFRSQWAQGAALVYPQYVVYKRN